MSQNYFQANKYKYDHLLQTGDDRRLQLTRTLTNLVTSVMFTLDLSSFKANVTQTLSMDYRRNWLMKQSHIRLLDSWTNTCERH